MVCLLGTTTPRKPLFGWGDVMTERIRASDLRAALARPKGTKRVMGADPQIVDGIRFDSKREARRWQELRLLEIAGYIRDLQRQVPIELEGKNGPILTPKGKISRYVADFTYFDVGLGIDVIEDAKGHQTDTYKMKRAILAAMGLEVKET